MFFTNYNSPLGKIIINGDDKNICGVYFENQKYFPHSIISDFIENKDLEIFKTTINWLERYFAKEKPKISELSLTPQGSDFRKLIWEILCKISYGETMTYGEIAKIAAKKLNKLKISAQAVGGAVGHNPISIIIPCHRVIGANGDLTGYAGGIDKKIKLLELEGIKINSLKNNKKYNIF